MAPAAGGPQTTSPPPARDPNSIRFAVIGDFGQDGPDEARVATLVHTWHPDFVVAAGDDNYPHGEARTIDDNIGKHYHDFIRFDAKYTGPYKDKGSAEQRFFAVPGNHDWHTPGAQPLLDYFDLPGNERYWQVRRGPVEIFGIDSDEREPDGIDATSTQAMWLKHALAESGAPWKIVVLHHPPFSSGVHGNNARLQWPFKAWGASAVLAGHDHHYERLIIDDFCYWIVGCSGAPLRAVSAPPDTTATVDLIYDKQHGALLVEATERVITLRFYTGHQELIDSYKMQH